MAPSFLSESSSPSPFAIAGTLVDSLEDWTLRIEEDVVLVIGQEGTILERSSVSQMNDLKERHSIEEGNVTFLRRDEFLMPGLIDSHIHASQFPNAGLALDLPLLKWLQRYTFPTEAKFGDHEFAQVVYERAVETTLAHGTTCAAYYGTIHRESTEILCDVAEQRGQRALVGKVCMNRNGFENYVETTSDSLNETKLFVSEVLGRRSRLVEPIITPRFVPTCDRELRVGLGDLAAKTGVRVQTHLGESRPEVAWVKELETDAQHYTDVYNRSGLLTDRTIMAHCVYLNDDELDMMRTAGAGISHCPNSNTSLKSGMMDVQRVRSKGVKVGLGTDCSGGYAASIVDSMRNAIGISNLLSCMESSPPEYQPITFAHAIYLATRGSAAVVSMADRIGALAPGYHFDAIRVRMNGTGNRMTSLFGHENVKDVVHKFVFLGDDRNVVQVFVDGKVVKDAIMQNVC